MYSNSANTWSLSQSHKVWKSQQLLKLPETQVIQSLPVNKNQSTFAAVLPGWLPILNLLAQVQQRRADKARVFKHINTSLSRLLAHGSAAPQDHNNNNKFNKSHDSQNSKAALSHEKSVPSPVSISLSIVLILLMDHFVFGND